MPSPRGPPPRRNKKQEQDVETNPWVEWAKTPTGLLSIVMVIITVAVLFSAMPGGDVETDSNLDYFLREFGIRKRRVDINCGYHARQTAEGCGIVAHGNLQRGETVLRVPQSGIIDQRSVMQDEEVGPLLTHNNATLVVDTFQESKAAGGHLPFFYAFYLANERRKGSYSKIGGWIGALPSTFSNALYWSEDIDACVDKTMLNEVEYYRRILNASVATAELICSDLTDVEQAKKVCSGGAFTEEELKWGLSVYFTRNFQDQAIVMGLDFANHKADSGLYPEWNRGEELLDVKVGYPTKKGDQLYTNYGKPPSVLMTAYGFWDASATYISANINFDVRSVTQLKKFNCDRAHEMVYTSKGRPRENLVKCVSVLVLTPEQRASGNLKALLKDDQVLMYTYGNLTYSLQQALQGMPQNAGENEVCNAKTGVAADLRDYQEFVQKLAIQSMTHVRERFEKYQKRVEANAPPATEEAADEQESTEEATKASEEQTGL